MYVLVSGDVAYLLCILFENVLSNDVKIWVEFEKNILEKCRKLCTDVKN